MEDGGIVHSGSAGQWADPSGMNHHLPDVTMRFTAAWRRLSVQLGMWLGLAAHAAGWHRLAWDRWHESQPAPHDTRAIPMYGGMLFDVPILRLTDYRSTAGISDSDDVTVSKQAREDKP